MSPPIQAPAPPLSEEILKLPGQPVEKATVSNANELADKVMKAADLYETIQAEAKQSLAEMHQERMFFLREQLKFLKNTEWRYQPIDKLIGSASNSQQT